MGTRLRRKKKRDKSLKDKSNYKKKREYLKSHGGWGMDYKEPKPWK